MRTEITGLNPKRTWRNLSLHYMPLIALLTFLLPSMMPAQTTFQSTGKTKVIRIDQQSEWRVHGVKAEAVNYNGKSAVRVSDAASPNTGDGDRLLLLSGTEFRDGVIELEMSGQMGPNASEQARGFVGLAFRATQDASRYECFYLRPTNGRADDQVRRNHSVQYISYPDFPWQRLRKESPEKYESYCDLTPGEWTKVRIEVHGSRAALYVNGVQQPTLIVTDLKLPETSGAIALWIGPGTVAHFTGLNVSQ